ncbi:MAG: hypothetical protein DYG86_05335, partial [Chloroflexi bacterium CFX2]|nr:hypothetical protein [Chloroflexi bacterium CFX2]
VLECDTSKRVAGLNDMFICLLARSWQDPCRIGRGGVGCDLVLNSDQRRDIQWDAGGSRRAGRGRGWDDGF